ncbi:MAG: hypothetical protein P4L98_19695 [Ancalomicrobiaceae bacterium]|nr:hypothetical protein [Ancalomicrobiaceae bacterium]
MSEFHRTLHKIGAVLAVIMTAVKIISHFSHATRQQVNYVPPSVVGPAKPLTPEEKKAEEEQAQAFAHFMASVREMQASH